MRIDFVTIFPRMFDPLLAEGIIARGIKQQLLDVRVWDLREFATDKHRSTDDEAYGGGPGMVMLAEPVLRCIDEVRGSRFEGRGENVSGTSDLLPRTSNLVPHLIMTSPKGRRFDQRIAGELREKKWIVFLCGRYEGFDERVREILQPAELSIGDFVVSGGELPALMLIDAVMRQRPGVLNDAESAAQDSFVAGLLDCPHYTRPERLEGDGGERVPEVLMSGHHEDIRRWRLMQSLGRTKERRPALLEGRTLTREETELLAAYGREAQEQQ